MKGGGKKGNKGKKDDSHEPALTKKDDNVSEW